MSSMFRAGAIVARGFASTSKIAAPRTLSIPLPSVSLSKAQPVKTPSKQEMESHYAKFLDIVEDEPVVTIESKEPSEFVREVYAVGGLEGKVSFA